MNLFLEFHLFAVKQNGDGMAIVLHNDPRGKNAIGDFVERLGVWGVEFDLYVNLINEPFTMEL